MTQSDLNRAVARQTGESKRCIRRMGFILLIPAAPFRPRFRVLRPLTRNANNAALFWTERGDAA
jgi:hypothetical protein